MKLLPTGLWLTLILSAFYLRIQAFGEPLWLDELHTSWVVSGGFHEVHHRAWAGNQTPLYYWLVWPIAKVTGGSPDGLRMISLLASLATVISLGWVVYRRTGSNAGALLVAFLASIDDKFVFYSVEARPYALVQLTGLWQLAGFAELVSRNTAGSGNENAGGQLRRTGWLAVLLLWLQPTTIILLVVEGLSWSINWIFRKGNGQPGRLRYKRGELALMTGLAAGPILAAGLLVENRHDWFRFVDPAAFSLMLGADLFIWIGIPVLAVAYAGLRQTGVENRSFGKIVFWTCGTAIGLTTIATFCGVAPLAEYRYLIAPVSGLLLCSGLLVSALPAAVKGCLVLLIVVVAIASNPLLPGYCQTMRLPSQRLENWSAVVDRINSDNAPVCFFPNLVEDHRLEENSRLDATSGQKDDYFLFALAGLNPLNGLVDDTRVCEAFSIHSPGTPSERMKSAIASHGGCWVLVRAWPQDAKRALGVVRGWPELRELGRQEFSDFSLPRLHLYRLGTVHQK
jgi:mannosyltransferase